MKKALVVSILLAGCGGGEKPPATPATPPAATAETPAKEATPAAPAPKPPLAEMQKKALAAMQAAYNAHDAKAYADLYSEGGAVYLLGPQGGWLEAAKGRPAIQEAQTKFWEMADTKTAASRVFVRDEIVAYEWTSTGTDKASGKNVSVRGAGVLTFDEDGKITKEYTFVDQLTPAMQLGRMPGKARETAPFTGEPTWHVAKKDAAEDKLVETVKNGWPVAWSKKDKKALEASVADDVVFEPIAQPSDVKGKAAAAKVLDSLTRAVPDATISVEPAWAAGDFVVATFTVKGTQKGPLGPVATVTNKPVTFHGLEIAEVKNGKVAKSTWYTNNVELLGQLGLLPAKDGEKKDEKKPAAKK